MEADIFDDFLDTFLTEDGPGLVESNALTKQPAKIRKKRPYKHSSYVCDKCRKSHRKCIHPNPRLEGFESRSSSSSGEDVEFVPSRASQELIRRKFLADVVPSTLGGTALPSAPVQFYIKNLSNFFVIPQTESTHGTFWTSIVPQLAHAYPLLGRSMLGLCYLFERCPRPAQLTPEDVLHHINSTLHGLQSSLAQFDHLEPVDKVISLVVTTFLAVATFHGIGSTTALQAHIHGIHALFKKAWSDFIAASSPARLFLLSTPSSLVKAEQLPIRVQDLNLVEPLIMCIPDAELDQTKIVYGSIVHLLVLTNKAIYARSAEIAANGSGFGIAKAGEQELQSPYESAFRDFCEYRANLPHDEGLRWACNTRVQPNLANAICKVFEQATFMQLKKQSGVQELNSAGNARSDISILEEKIAHAKRLDPSIQLHWAEQVLGDVKIHELLAIEALTESSASSPEENGLIRRRRSPTLASRLQPWSRLDEILSAPTGRNESFRIDDVQWRD